MYQALYRVWRPQTFSDMVGQTAIVRTLRNQVRTRRIAHAYLFCGSRGTGKTSAAKIMARAVNCENPRDGDPCGECLACKMIESGMSLDVVEMDAASNSGVDQVRELLEQVDYPPQFGRYKVYIIDEVHMLSTAAFNALLKTIEEPPEYMCFIMATTEPQKVPATILSRCQRFDFGRFTLDELIGRMKQASEGQPVTEEAYTLIAQAAEGGMRDALSLLDMCLGLGGEVTEASVRTVLGAADSQTLFDLADRIGAGDQAGALQVVARLYGLGVDVSVFLRDFSRHIRSLTMARICGPEALTGMSAERAQRYAAQAADYPEQKLLRVMEYMMQAESDVRWASSARSVLEMAVIRAANPPDTMDNAALLERVETLENRLKQLESGAVTIAAPRKQAAGEAAASAAPASEAAPVKPSLPPVPQSEAEIWKNALSRVRTDGMMSFLSQGRFLGVQDGAYTLGFPPGKDYFLTLLTDDRKRAVVEALEACGAVSPSFRVQMLEDKAAQKRKTQADESEQILIEAFGRENVQVSEPKDAG